MSRVHSASADFHALFRSAQRQADRHTGPAEPWRPGTQRWREGAVRSVVGLSMLLGVGMAAWHFSALPSVRERPALRRQLPPVVPIGPGLQHRQVGEPITANKATGMISRVTGEITIDVVDMPLAQAAGLLIAVTHGRLAEGKELLATARPVTLHWQGRDVATAWRLLLPSDTNYAARCGAVECTLWILGSASTVASPPAVIPASREPIAALPEASATAAAPSSVAGFLRSTGDRSIETSGDFVTVPSAFEVLQSRGEWPDQP